MSAVADIVVSGAERTGCSAENRLCPSVSCCSDCEYSPGNSHCDNLYEATSNCESATPVSREIIRTSTFSEGLLWWCRTTCRRWLEESAFLGVIIMRHPTLLLVLCASLVFRIAGACSSRSTPRPRPPSPTVRPNITFQTYACPEAYAKWYCLNGATCFSVKIGESILYNCECADGYVGQRCEFKDLEGSYLASRQQVMIETASIAGGVTLLILIIVILSVAVYVHYKRRRKERLQPRQVLQAYQPFGSFRESETNGHSRPLRTTDPESGRKNHGETIASALLSSSNRSRTVQ